MGRGKQFGLLLWKNFVIQRRHPIGAAFQIILPAVLAAILVIIRQETSTISHIKSTDFRPFSLALCPLSVIPPAQFDDEPVKSSTNEVFQITYAPQNKATELVMNVAARLFVQPVEVIGFPNEAALIEYYKSNDTGGYGIGSVIFVDIKSVADFTGNVTYKMRVPLRPKSSFLDEPDSWLTDFTYPGTQEPGPRDSGDPTGGKPGYCNKAFLSMQHAVAMGIAKAVNPDAEHDVDVLLRRFPYPPYMSDMMLAALKQFLPLIIMLSLLYPAFDLVKSLVLEKEKRLKEAMKIMGLTDWLHWTSWFTKALIFFGIDALIIAFLMCCDFGTVAVLAKSDGTLVFVFLLLYVLSGICFCFMLSTFFSKANSAATAAGIIWFASYIPYFFLAPRYVTMTYWEKMAACLICNTCMAFGGMQIYMNEGTGFGLQWAQLGTPISPDDNFTMANVFFMLIFDSLLYLLITWYVDSVFPGEFGMPQPFYFLFTRQYWCGSKLTDKVGSQLQPTHKNSHPEFFEEPPHGLQKGVEIHGFTKVFNKNKVAVNNLSLDMFENEITVLLGHNGAGKTTTMSMLTGLFPPSRGEAFINGFSIHKDLKEARKSLGLCPQYNVVFDDLNVEEHLIFACKLKECEPSLVNQEVEAMLIATNLVDKRLNLSSQLSGGMKRRLCVGMALVGGSKVVMLDEPTSGMDPTARRFTWDLLQAQSKGRTILLTTHFMDEADILGDRIAIMAKGEVQCHGSPMFLKKKYGAGYHMIVVKEAGCNVENIKSLVHSIVPKAELESNIGAELSFILPHASSNKFPHLFTQIEAKKQELRISSYGASVTTMEEVFLRVGEQSDSSLKRLLQNNGRIDGSFQGPPSHENGLANGNSNSALVAVDIEQHGRSKRNTGLKLYMQQFRAMVVKRMVHTKRNWLLILVQLVVPVFIVIIALVVLHTLPTEPPQPPLTLNLEPFHGSVVPYSYTGVDGDPTATLGQLFASQFDPAHDVTVPVLSKDTTADLNAYLLNEGIKDAYSYSMHYIVAASFYMSIPTKRNNVSKLTAAVMFNDQPFHSPAIAMSFLDTTLIRYYTGIDDFYLTVVNDPMPLTYQEEASDLAKGVITSFQISFNMMFGISFLVSSFIVFLVKERSSDAKHLQFVSGVRALNFWTSTLVWDFVNYIIPCLCIMLVFIVFQQDGFNTAIVQGCLLLIFVLFGLCVLPFTYLLSFMFSVASTAYARVTMFNIFSGVVALITITIMNVINEKSRDTAKILDWVFMALPNYCLGAGVKDIYLNYYNMAMCRKYPQIQSFCNCDGTLCLNYNKNYLAWQAPGIGRMIFFLSLWAVLYFLLVLFMEMGLGRRLTSFIFSVRWRNRSPSPGHVNPMLQDLLGGEDSDVIDEQRRIHDTPMASLFATDNLVVKDLSKYYGIFRPFMAVDHLSFGVPRGECFGLLGINGAGKTTTFKMLTGDEAVSEGDAYVEGFGIHQNMKQVRQRLGYCPQFDAIIDQMTGRETLVMFARLRGVVEREIPDLVQRLSRNLLFSEHIDKLVKDYSGGNKRKLSTAVALIGDPPIVFLDEPTTGMDPLARRLVWDTISRVRDSGSSVILTSHSMEECDVLCTRLAIMVNGRFKCVGSPQHLKNKFGKGYTLTAKIQNNSLTASQMPELTNKFQKFILKTFPGSILKDQHHGMVHYQVPGNGMSWGTMFGALENAKIQYHLEDYSIGQTTLEQVFLSFTRIQNSAVDD